MAAYSKTYSTTNVQLTIPVSGVSASNVIWYPPEDYDAAAWKFVGTSLASSPIVPPGNVFAVKADGTLELVASNVAAEAPLIPPFRVVWNPSGPGYFSMLWDCKPSGTVTNLAARILSEMSAGPEKFQIGEGALARKIQSTIQQEFLVERAFGRLWPEPDGRWEFEPKMARHRAEHAPICGKYNVAPEHNFATPTCSMHVSGTPSAWEVSCYFISNVPHALISYTAQEVEKFAADLVVESAADARFYVTKWLNALLKKLVEDGALWKNACECGWDFRGVDP